MSMQTIWFGRESRAVSPVIGIILVVAIVIILATVVGGFALGLTEEINEPAPQAALELEFEETDVESDGNGGSEEYDKFLWQMKLLHNSGNEVDGEDIFVYVRHGEEELTGELNGTLTAGDSVEVFIVHTTDSERNCDDENVACSLAGNPDNFPDENHIDLLLVHEPSNTILYDERIEISGNYGIYNDEEDRSDDELTFA